MFLKGSVCSDGIIKDHYERIIVNCIMFFRYLRKLRTRNFITFSIRDKRPYIIYGYCNILMYRIEVEERDHLLNIKNPQMI